MNYETKYKQALEKASKLRVQNPFDTVGQMVEYIFPELKESEDEKIRKAIHIYLDWLDGRKDYAPKGIYSIKDMIAWLEKQSGKKSADEVLKIRQELYQSGYNDGYKHGQEDTAISLEKESIEVDKRIRKELIVIKNLIEDKNTSEVNKVILRDVLDEFKQFTNSQSSQFNSGHLLDPRRGD